MKSTALFLMMTASVVLLDVPAAEANNVPAATESAVKAEEEAFFKRRRKGPRRKRGFMWGLFKKKDCGCPKF
jgi:hypothetical protein